MKLESCLELNNSFPACFLSLVSVLVSPHVVQNDMRGYSNVAVKSTVDLSETQRELSQMVDLSEYPT